MQASLGLRAEENNTKIINKHGQSEHESREVGREGVKVIIFSAVAADIQQGAHPPPHHHRSHSALEVVVQHS